MNASSYQPDKGRPLKPESRSVTIGRWHITGAGRIGSLAAYYLVRAGADVTVIRPGAPHIRNTALYFDDETAPPALENLSLQVRPPQGCGEISRLVVACKTPYTTAAQARLQLAENATIIRLQNGIGSLDGELTPGQRLIEAVTSSAVMHEADNTLRVVAENATTFGGGEPPGWFNTLAHYWPKLTWSGNIQPAQWRKLVANAAINALTAIHDVPNGALLERTELKAEMTTLIYEADTLLTRLDPSWPGSSYGAVAGIVSATAANTSSMRADIRSGGRTEIEAINGWLLRQAIRVGLDLPAHRRIVDRIQALGPD